MVAAGTILRICLELFADWNYFRVTRRPNSLQTSLVNRRQHVRIGGKLAKYINRLLVIDMEYYAHVVIQEEAHDRNPMFRDRYIGCGAARPVRGDGGVWRVRIADCVPLAGGRRVA